MKCSAAIILAAGAVCINAQSIGDIGSLPECGQVCINNMIGKASDFNCQSTDVACLCRSQDFIDGIRDCSSESCGDSAEQVIQYGVGFCRGQGVDVGGSSSQSGGGAAATSGAAGAGNTGGDSTTVVPVGTSTFESTVFSTSTSDTGESGQGTATTGGGAGGAGGSADTTATATATATDGGNGNGAGGAGNTQGSGGDNGGDDGSGATHQSASPAGLLVAAGIVALLI